MPQARCPNDMSNLDSTLNRLSHAFRASVMPRFISSIGTTGTILLEKSNVFRSVLFNANSREPNAIRRPVHPPAATSTMASQSSPELLQLNRSPSGTLESIPQRQGLAKTRHNQTQHPRTPAIRNQPGILLLDDVNTNWNWPLSEVPQEIVSQESSVRTGTSLLGKPRHLSGPPPPPRPSPRIPLSPHDLLDEREFRIDFPSDHPLSQSPSQIPPTIPSRNRILSDCPPSQPCPPAPIDLFSERPSSQPCPPAPIGFFPDRTHSQPCPPAPIDLFSEHPPSQPRPQGPIDLFSERPPLRPRPPAPIDLFSDRPTLQPHPPAPIDLFSDRPTSQSRPPTTIDLFSERPPSRPRPPAPIDLFSDRPTSHPRPPVPIDLFSDRPTSQLHPPIPIGLLPNRSPSQPRPPAPIGLFPDSSPSHLPQPTSTALAQDRPTVFSRPFAQDMPTCLEDNPTCLDFTRIALHRSNTRTKFPQVFPVRLNIYDMTRANNWMSSLGVGVFHSGIQVHGVEYGYGGHGYSFSGIFEMCPQNDAELGSPFRFRESILLGHTSFTPDEVREMVDEIGEHFTGSSYHLTQRNCNHFTNILAQLLTGEETPTWINRLASIGANLPRFLQRMIPSEWLQPYALTQQAEMRNQGETTDPLLLLMDTQSVHCLRGDATVLERTEERLTQMVGQWCAEGITDSDSDLLDPTKYTNQDITPQRSTNKK
ncbi:unnamed protein product [Cyprideis torosa]|uniref:Uncharacterized protein n=1 Tax=Cyprideis torosa TaxID=163714 RepID=A0A7R8W5F8_9CRUS|nr:unnamed protein product [Cyprideis torosa]CAG0885142.1 unnamed protein product [Cyprideis torosa]